MKPFSLCVLGNSHAAAIAQAWKRRSLNTRNSFRLQFFAARTQLLRHLRLENGVFHTEHESLAESLKRTSGGECRIDIARYDAFLLVGLGYRLKLGSIGAPYGTIEHLKWREVDTLLSVSCFKALMEASLEDNMAMRLAANIRSSSHAPILINPSPFKTVLSGESKRHGEHIPYEDREFLEFAYAQYKSAAEGRASKSSAEIIWQDESTIAVPGFTKTEYCVGALRLRDDVDREGEDGLHMNEAYGLLMLSKILTRLNDISGGLVLDSFTQSPGAVGRFLTRLQSFEAALGRRAVQTVVDTCQADGTPD